MFPPIAGSGIQRSLKFIKYLPQFGIEPIVFAPRKARWKAYDPKNLDLPYLKKIKIYRYGIDNLSRYYDLRFNRGYEKHPYFYALALKYMWFIDFFSSWYFQNRTDAVQIAVQEKVAAVFTTSPPHSVHLFGSYLKKQLRIPWLMDLRDAMVDEPNRDASKLPGRIQAQIEKSYEARFYQKSDAIISVSQPILDSLVKQNPAIDLKPKIHLIPNGFDQEDFDSISIRPRSERPMVVTYTGAFLQKRTPKYFLDALQSLVISHQIDPQDILVRFVGYFDNRIHALMTSYADLLPIEILGYQPHLKTLEYQVNSDVLLLIVSLEEKEGGGQIFTGKFFEYIGARRPVFALVPEGPLKKTIVSMRAGWVVPPKNTMAIASQFRIMVETWKQTGQVPYSPDDTQRTRFTRKRLTAKLAQLITSMT